MRHVPTLRWTIGILAAFCCCVVAAGHGVAPLGLLLVLGIVQEPAPGIVGWAALGALPVAWRMRSRWLYALGLVGLATIWGVAWKYSAARELLVFTSAPFLFLLAVQLRDVIFGVKVEDSASTA